MTPEEKANLRAIFQAAIDALDKDDTSAMILACQAMIQWGLSGLNSAMQGKPRPEGETFVMGVEKL